MSAALRSALLLITLAAGCEPVIPEVKGADGALADGGDGAADGADGTTDSGGADGSADGSVDGSADGGGDGATDTGGADGGAGGGGDSTDPVPSAYEGSYDGGVTATAAGDWGTFVMCEGSGAYVVNVDGLLTANFACEGDRGPDYTWEVDGTVDSGGVVSATALLSDSWGGPPIDCTLEGEIGGRGELSVHCDAEVSFGGGGGGGTFDLSVDGWGS